MSTPLETWLIPLICKYCTIINYGNNLHLTLVILRVLSRYHPTSNNNKMQL